MRVHIVVYAVFVASILFDMATTTLGFQLGGLPVGGSHQLELIWR